MAARAADRTTTTIAFEATPLPAPADPPLPTHDPFEPAFARTMHERVIAPLGTHWFRTRLIGAQRIPAHGPVILAANHSGNAFPYDAVAVDHALWRRDGYDAAAKVRAAFEPGLTFRWWMRPFGIDDLWRRGGGVDMTFDNLDRLLARGDRVLYFPEGVPGIGKGFHRRYRLQRFSTSFVRLGARHGAPVVPLYIVNGEWINPFGFPLRWLDRLVQRVAGVPFFPLPIGVLGVVFPFVWFFAFPAKLTVVVGEPIDVRGMARDAGLDPDVPDRDGVNALAARVRHVMQAELDRLKRVHGRRPWDWRTLVAALRRAKGVRWRAVPLGWPLSFVRTARDAAREPARCRLHAVLRDLDLVCFYLPFGWLGLSLARRLRRAPYGHRGMTTAEARERRGEYLWRLAERPLPARDASGEPRAPPPAGAFAAGEG